MTSAVARLPRLSLRRAGAAAAAVGLTVGWLLWLLPSGLGGPLSLVWVNGASMEPTYHDGDLAIVYRLSDYDVGDVVAFEVGSSIVIHRIVAEGDAGYVLQGDNRGFQDPWNPSHDQILGRALLTVPGGARVIGILRQPMVLAGLAAALVFGYGVRRQPAGTDGVDAVPDRLRRLSVETLLAANVAAVCLLWAVVVLLR